MGIAWISAVALIALIGWRGRFVSRRLALIVALAPAWVFMLVSLASVEDGLEILRLRLRGFEVVNRPGADFRIAHVDAPIERDTPAIAIERVRGLSKPIGVHVDRIVVRTPTAAAIRTRPAFSVRLTYPDDPGVFIGLEDEDHPFPYNQVYELAHGDTITVCPHDSRCETRRITIRKEGGRWSLGPCALSGWLGGEMRATTRTFALLDLYHYAEDRCSPRRVTGDTGLWVREAGADRPTEDDVRSFFLYQQGRLFFALLDPEALVATSFASNRPDEAVTHRVSSGAPVRIKLMWKQRRFLQDRIYDDPSIDRPLCGYAGSPDERDYSGRRFCKRIRVYLPETELRVSLGEDVRVTLPPNEAPAVSLTCSRPPMALDPVAVSRERCDDSPLTAAYAANTRFRPQGVALLSFPVRLVGGEPISEVLRVEDGEDCAELSRPCLVSKGRAQERAYPIGGVAALGSGDSERHLLDATLFMSPRWLWLFVAAASLQVLLLFGLRTPLIERVPLYPAAVVGAVFLLLTVRLLFAYKVVALFPHDQEAIDLAVSGILIVPALIAALAWPVTGRRDAADDRRSSPPGPLEHPRFAGLRAAAVGALVLAVATRLSVVSAPDRFVALAWMAGLAAIALLASGLVGAIATAVRSASTVVLRAIPLDRIPRRARDLTLDQVLWGALGLLLAVRGLLSVYGRESLGGVRVLLWFLPAMFLVTGAVLARLQASPRRAMAATLGIAVVAFIAQWTDKGAAVVVCVPIVAIGLFLSARELRETPATRVIVGAVLIAGISFGAIWSWSRLTEASLPPVRDGPSRWAMLSQSEGGKNLLCPADPRIEDGAIDLERYSPLFDLSNTEVRLREFLVPGAATRIGTRVSTRVAESLAIMRRYAAGKETSFWGSGYLSAPVREYGPHELRALLSDGVASVLVASEGGTAGMLGLMSLYLVLIWVALRHAGLLRDGPALSFSTAWPGLIALFSMGWMTWFMCAGNIGLLLFSGQNVPFLVVQSGMDVALPTLLFGLALTLPAPEDDR